MSNPSRVIVLVEDEHQKMLIYRYLISCRFKRNEITISPSPSGRGSAERWVREEFVKEADACRNRQARARTALIVMIDADTLSVQDRFNQLDQALRERGKPTVGEGERIARLVPRRNVETWILYLNDEQDVNEDTDYAEERRKWHELIPPAAEMLCQLTQSKIEPPDRCISSLRIGTGELRGLRS
ncbi:MAG: hypothetical protein ACLQVL_21640 [Terriglobia bacterium]